MNPQLASLSLRDLDSLVSLAEHAHFGLTARACSISQPALSAQIKKIESALGVRIFERGRRGVRATPAGEAIIAQARAVLEEAEKLSTEAMRAGGDEAPGPFRLGAIATVGPYLLPHLIGPLRKRFPAMALGLREGLTDALIETLRRGELDAVLLSPPLHDDSLHVEPLYEEDFWLAVPSGHPLARADAVAVRDLDPRQLLLLEEGHCLRDQALEICAAHRLRRAMRPPAGGRATPPLPPMQATSLETLRQMVAAGLGCTLMPRLAVEGGLGGTRARTPLKRLIVYREFAPPAPRRTIALAWRKRHPRPALLRAVIEVLRANFLPEVSAIPASIR